MDHKYWNLPPDKGSPGTNPELEARILDWCGAIARQAHGGDDLARVIYEAVAYGIHRQPPQLRTIAVLLKPDGNVNWMRGGGGGPTNFITRFAQLVALVATAENVGAGAIITETWVSLAPLAPGERPSYQSNRGEAVLIAAQARNASPVYLILPIINGLVAPPTGTQQDAEGGSEFGRFIALQAPSAAEQAAAQALLRRFRSGQPSGRCELTPEQEKEITRFNPTAKPRQW